MSLPLVTWRGVALAWASVVASAHHARRVRDAGALPLL